MHMARAEDDGLAVNEIKEPAGNIQQTRLFAGDLSYHTAEMLLS